MNLANQCSAYTTIEQFKTLDICLIDTSSLIYLKRLGIAEKTGHSLHLYTIPEVVREFGTMPDYIRLLSVNIPVSGVDKKLLACAIRSHWPLISEDKDLLKAMNHHGLTYFNALMMIYFLFFKGIITPPECRALVTELKTFARYSRHIWTYGYVLAEGLGIK